MGLLDGISKQELMPGHWNPLHHCKALRSYLVIIQLICNSNYDTSSLQQEVWIKLALSLFSLLHLSYLGSNPNNLDVGIGSATVLIAILVVTCLGCMFCACIMRRLRVNANIETVNNNSRANATNYTLVDQAERNAAADTIPPSYTDVLQNPSEYTQVNDEPDGVPPQSPPPNSPPPSYTIAFLVPTETLRVVQSTDSSTEGGGEVRREIIPIPLSPPPSYDDAAPQFPTPDTNRSGQSLPDVVTISRENSEQANSPSTEAEPEEREETLWWERPLSMTVTYLIRWYVILETGITGEGLLLYVKYDFRSLQDSALIQIISYVRSAI